MMHILTWGGKSSKRHIGTHTRHTNYLYQRPKSKRPFSIYGYIFVPLTDTKIATFLLTRFWNSKGGRFLGKIWISVTMKCL
jgi:hypothetical protein